MIVTANNAAVDAKYPYFIGQEWDPGLPGAADHRRSSRRPRPRRRHDRRRSAPSRSTPTSSRADAIVPFVGQRRARRRDGRRARRAADPRLATFDCPVDGRRASAARPTWRSSTAWSAACSTTSSAPLAREYVGGGASWQATDRACSTSPTRRGGTTRRRPTGARRATTSSAAALDEAGRGAAGGVRRPGELDVGRDAHGDVRARRRSGSSGIGPLEWYFDKGPYPAPGAAGAVEQHLLPAVAGLPGPGRPDVQAGRASTACSRSRTCRRTG